MGGLYIRKVNQISVAHRHISDNLRIKPQAFIRNVAETIRGSQRCKHTYTDIFIPTQH